MQKKELVKSVKLRWKYTNDILAGLCLSVLSGVIIYSVVTATEVPNSLWLIYEGVVLAAATWAFGVDLIDKWKETNEQ